MNHKWEYIIYGLLSMLEGFLIVLTLGWFLAHVRQLPTTQWIFWRSMKNRCKVVFRDV